jgi:hypothetical protein
LVVREACIVDHRKIVDANVENPPLDCGVTG